MAGLLPALLLLLPAQLSAIDASWVGADGNWSQPVRWSTNPDIPNNNGVAYDVTIGPSTGPVTLDLDVTIDSLLLDASDLIAATGQSFGLSIIGPFVWDGGVHSGGGMTIVNGTASLRNAANVLDGRTLVLDGNSALTHDLTLLNGATIHNHAQMTLSSQRDLFGYDGSLVNTGRVLTASSSVNVLESAWQQTADGVLDVRGRLRMFNGGSHSGEINIGTTAAFPDTAVLQLYSSAASGPVVHTFEAGSIVRGAGTGNKIEIEGDSLEDSVTAHFNGDIDLEAGTFSVTRGTANVRVTADTRLGDKLQGLSEATVRLVGAAPDTEVQINEVDFSFLSTLQTESVSNLNVGTLSLTQSAGLETADDLNLNADTVFINTALTLSNTDLTVGQTGTISDGNVLQLDNSSLIVAPDATLSVFGGSEAFPTVIGPASAPQPASGDVHAQSNGELILWLLERAVLHTFISGDQNRYIALRQLILLSIDPILLIAGQAVLTADAVENPSGTVQGEPGCTLTIDNYTCGTASTLWLDNSDANLGVPNEADYLFNGRLECRSATLDFFDRTTGATVGGMTGTCSAAPGETGPTLSSHLNSGLDLRLNGLWTVGQTPGKLAVTADAVAFEAGLVLAMEIGGAGQGVDYDWLDIDGGLSVGGELQLFVIDGYEAVIQPADTFTIITSGAVIQGAFANAANGGHLDTADGKGSFAVNYGEGSAHDPNVVVLSDFQPAPGGPLLGAPEFRAGGEFRFSLTGIPGSNYVIEATEDFEQWLPIATNPIPPGGELTVDDPQAPAFSNRFYRALRP